VSSQTWHRSNTARTRRALPQGAVGSALTPVLF
jgi:hypothetical protein